MRVHLLLICCILSLHFPTLVLAQSDKLPNDCPPGLVDKVTRDRSFANGRTADDFTYLGMSVYTNRPQCVEFLLHKGAEVNAVFGQYKTTALYLAAQEGLSRLAGILLDAGADINARHAQGGCTPLCAALLKKHVATAELLIRRGAAVKDINHAGTSALHLAAQFGLVELIKLLLDRGVDVNLRTNNKFGVSPLQDAALEGQTAAVELLLGRGADVNQISSDGYTPLDDAVSKTRTEIIEILKRQGAKRAQELR